MSDNYECPKCHNIFPIQNKIMHDLRCTEESPMALDKSRQIQLNKSNDSTQNSNIEKKEIKVSQEKPPEEIHQNPNPQPQRDIQESKLKLAESGEFPEIFVCDICGETLALSEKKDHMLCHNIEKEEIAKLNNQNNFNASSGEIEEQKQIERQIERENEMRRQMQNQQDQRRNQQQNQQSHPNNLFDSDTNMLTQSDIDFFGSMGMPGIQNIQTHSNYQNNQQPNIHIRTVTTGPHGETIVRQYGSRENENIMINPFRMMFGNTSSNSRRINLPFSNFNDDPNMPSLFEQLFRMMRNQEHPTDQAILNELPETQIDDVTKLDPEKKNCVICLEDFKNGDKATVLPCIHLFHTTCIQNWLKTQNCCPICKFKLTGENLNSQP